MLRPVDPTWTATEIAEIVRGSRCPFTLGLPASLTIELAQKTLAEAGTDEAWLAYDLLHQLETFGRAF